MKLLIVHSSADLYGSDRSLLAICRAALRSGHEVTVRLPGFGALNNELEKLGVSIEARDVAVLRRSMILKVRDWVQLLQVTSRDRRYGRDVASSDLVVLTNTSAVLSGKFIARGAKAPHVQIVREIFSNVVERLLFQTMLRPKDSTVFVSEAVESQFSRGRSRRWASTQVVPSGAKLLHHAPTPLRETNGKLNVVCVGRLNGWKGQEVLIEAISILKSRGIETSVRIVGGEFGGGDYYTSKLQSQILQANLSAEVELVGEVSDPTNHVLEADVAVVPSTRAEPFGKVVIEALNASRPVIASDHGGPAEVLSDGIGGVLFRSGDSAHLAAILESFSSDRTLLQKVSVEAFAKSLHYSEDTSAERIVNFAEKAASGE